MPLHFTSASLGGWQQAPYFQAHDWQIGIAYRRVKTDKVFVGSQENNSAGPGGQPLYLNLNTLDLSATYATNEHLSLGLTLPLSFSSADNIHPDGQYHTMSATGIGDVSLMGDYWIGAPSKHPRGNVLVALGVKAPTGSNHKTDSFYTSPGSSTQTPVPQTVQPGDGGWATLLEADAFKYLSARGSIYATGFYSVSLTQHTDVLWAPAGTFWAVPDVYMARLGVSYDMKSQPWLTASVGGRIDGTPTSDLVGGKTDYYRHSGYTVYVEPGLALQSGPNQFTLSVPVRVSHNYTSMTLSSGQTRGGIGGVADFVVYLGYYRRI